MISNDFLKVKGSVTITVTSQNGNVKQEISVPNLVVNTGRTYIAARMVSDATPIMSYMAIGSNNIVTQPSDIALVEEISRVNLSSFFSIDNKVTATATFGEGSCDGEITEAGIFDASEDGNMLCRTTFAPVYKELNDTFSITWVIEFITASTY